MEHTHGQAAENGGHALPWPFDTAAGALCLEFANTVGDRPVTPTREETLHDYGDLLAWAGVMGTLPPARFASARAAATARPDDAATVFAAAIALREAIYRVFSAVAAGNMPPGADLDALNAAYGGAMRHALVAQAGNDFGWAWGGAADALDAPLWPVARSAAELLVSPERGRVRACAGPDCSWLFLDTTKNGGRHWCNMRTCGNRAKARRHRARGQTRVAGTT